MAFELSNLKGHNSELLKLLTQHLPDMLWVKDLDGYFIYVNQAVCDGLLMAKDVLEPIGKNDVYFALRERAFNQDKPYWHTFGELCSDSDYVVIENNKAMKFEEYGNIKGELLYLEVFKAPFYDKDGKIIGTVGVGRDITELKKIQLDLEKNLQVLEYQANHDDLTDLVNRKLFTKKLNDCTQKSPEDRLAILFIDLDDFKEVNDSFGHDYGDKILLEARDRIQSFIKDSDVLSRFGGDEFCILLNDTRSNESISLFVENIMQAFKKAFSIKNLTSYISISVGVSLFPDNGNDANTLLKNADAAMYKAKHDGKNRYRFYNEEMTKRALEKVYLETELRKAFNNDELVVYYQAQIDASDDTLVGMEALVRWNHSSMGFVYPDRFIPIAENNGMIVELDRIVMKQAVSQFSQWKKAGLNPSKISINLTIKQIEEDDLVDFIKMLVEEENILYSDLEFEITETQIMNNPEESIKTLHKISDLGISLAIDDFGTGYSSLVYLKKLPINKLKIDKSFVDNLPSDTKDAAISKTIISLCENLDFKVIAEGVETKEQKEYLLENNCNLIQGYLYSKPISAQDMTEYLHTKKI